MKATIFHQNSGKVTITHMQGHTQELLCKFLHCVKDHPESKTFDTREMVRVSRGDRVSIFSDFDRGEVEFLRGSILVDFRYFLLFSRQNRHDS